LAIVYEHVPHPGIERGAQLVFHLHSLKNDKRASFGYWSSRLAGDFDDSSWHWRNQEPRVGSSDVVGVMSRTQSTYEGRAAYTLIGISLDLEDFVRLAGDEYQRWRPKAEHLDRPLLPINGNREVTHRVRFSVWSGAHIGDDARAVRVTTGESVTHVLF